MKQTYSLIFFLFFCFSFFIDCFLYSSIQGFLWPTIQRKIKRVKTQNFRYQKKTKKLTRQSFWYNRHKFTFYDHQHSKTIDIVTQEILDHSYPLSTYTFEPGDIVIDIGAHVGIISIPLAKQHPEITVYAFEPCIENFKNLQRNIKINKVSNIKIFNLAVTGKSGEFVDVYDLSVAYQDGGSGSSSLLVHQFYNNNKDKIQKNAAQTISLDDIFTHHQIQKCALLKIDCEGSEYDVLLKSEKFKSGIVQQLVGEFHINNSLTAQGYSREKLVDYCRKYVQGKVQVMFNYIND